MPAAARRPDLQHLVLGALDAGGDAARPAVWASATLHCHWLPLAAILCTVILLALLAFSAKMTMSPTARLDLILQQAAALVPDPGARTAPALVGATLPEQWQQQPRAVLPLILDALIIF